MRHKFISKYKSVYTPESNDSWKKIISDPDTQDINLEEYDAVSNGLQMNFKFLGGVGWHELDLLLEQYKSVWN